MKLSTHRNAAQFSVVVCALKRIRRAALLAMLMALAAACGDASTSAEDYLLQARQHLADADYAAAEIELKNALRLDGKSAEARFLLGKIYLERDDNLDAEKELLRAQALGWQADEVLPALAAAYLAQAKTTEVLALSQDGLQAPATAQLLSLQAIAAMLEGKRDEAAGMIRMARTTAPESLEAKLAEARLLALQGSFGGAFSLIDQVLAQAPTNASAWRLKGQILLRQQKLADARAAIDQAIAHASITFSDHLTRALINLQMHDIAGAEADSAELLRQLPNNPGSSYVRGLLYFNDKSYRQAITELTRAKYAAQKYPMLLYYMSLAYVLDGNLDAGAKFAREFVDLAPDDINGRKLLALLLLHQHQASAAQTVLQPVLDFNPDDVGALSIMASALLQDDKADLGLLSYARIATLSPQTPVAQLPQSAGLLDAGLGLATDAAGDLEARLNAQAEYPGKEMLQLLELLQQKDFTQAIAVAESYMWRVPEKIAPYNVLGNIYLASGQGDKAVEAYQKALARDPGDPSANGNLAQLARARGDTAGERGYYKAVLAKHPDSLSALLRLALLEGREQDTAGMVSLLQQAVDQQPTALEPRLGLARYYLDSGNAARVAPLFSPLLNLQQRSPRVLELYAQAQLAQQNYPSAYLALEELVAVQPQSAQSQYLLWRAATGIGNSQRARQALDEALRLDANHLPSVLALAGIAQQEGSQELLAQLLATATRLAPEDAAVLRLRARAARQSGDLAGAAALAERAFAAQGSSANFLEVMAVRRAAGRQGEARTAMQQWIDAHPEDVDVRLAFSDMLQQDNDVQAAQLQYRKVLALQPNNVLALNNLAWSLRVEDPAQALEYIRTAARVAPAEPAVLDTLAVIEHLNGENAAASETIKRALAAAPGNPGMLYHQAMIVAALGDKPAAIAALEALLGAAHSDFPERGDAQQLLQALRR